MKDMRNIISEFYLIPRGYIGQEHLTGFNLININARIYDPLLGVFLSPDNYVSDPGNFQNNNRFGYCNNNPVRQLFGSFSH
jgi:RHS repeat-associated protein